MPYYDWDYVEKFTWKIERKNRIINKIKSKQLETPDQRLITQ